MPSGSQPIHPTDIQSLPETGYVRLSHILAPKGPIPVSRSTWWAGVKTQRFPKPVKLGSRITMWRVEDIRALIASLNVSPG
jgi:prophage regulatory protein